MPLRGKSNNQLTSTSGIASMAIDPSSPNANDLWILEEDIVGQAVGLLLSITQASCLQYQLCKYTSTNIIIRTTKI